MDSYEARRIIDRLLGKNVGGWDIVGHRGTGKSAVVFDATREGRTAALKVFDPALVEASGKDKQLKRIDRELTLRGKHHPNLVEILDGGHCVTTGHLFVVMELIDAPNLASVIDDFPRDKIRPIIAQVASAARFLEDLGIVHRDIKTDNIAITPDFKNATLLDLGVIRPLQLTGADPSSDGQRRSFVGTLRYSSPEFAFRREKQDPEGWRALTFYQLGAVLHDVIMRKRLFEEFSDPYTRLVKAVEDEIPAIQSIDVPDDIVLLARNCLLKDPKLRLRFVDWNAFDLEQSVLAAGIAAKERLRRRFALAQEAEAISAVNKERLERLLEGTIQSMQSTIRNEVISECTGKDFIPRVESREFQGPPSSVGFLLLLFNVKPDPKFNRSLSILLRFEVLDQPSSVVQIGYAAASGGSGITREQANLVVTTPLFSGAFQDHIVKVAVMDVVYQLLDAAQQDSGTDKQRWLAGSLTEGL
jgi:serine/threonine protein kinase